VSGSIAGLGQRWSKAEKEDQHDSLEPCGASVPQASVDQHPAKPSQNNTHRHRSYDHVCQSITPKASEARSAPRAYAVGLAVSAVTWSHRAVRNAVANLRC
jgi:hypothetical protein